MVEQKILTPGETYLFTKEILSINVWFPKNQRKWAVETGRKNLAIFLLPIGQVLGFTIVKNKIFILITLHPKEVLLKVPKERKNQSYILTSGDLDRYVAGELPPIASQDSDTYEGENLSVSIRKRFANFLQSFSLQYNRHYGRTDRLSARYTGIFKLNNDDEIRKVLAEMQNAPFIHEDKRDLSECYTNSYHLEDAEIRKVISYEKVIVLFGGKIKLFQEYAKAIRLKLKQLEGAFEYLRKIPPGMYLNAD